MHDTLLLFGATGDLAQRYLFPSLLHLWRDRLLPDSFRLVAASRWTTRVSATGCANARPRRPPTSRAFLTTSRGPSASTITWARHRVQNLLALRLGNTLMEAAWQHRWIGRRSRRSTPRGRPSGALELRPMSLDLPVSPSTRRIAFERLLVDALRGKQTLFVRVDEVEAAWCGIDSIERAWSQSGTPVRDYPAGSRGPAEVAGILPGTLTRSRVGKP